MVRSTRTQVQAYCIRGSISSLIIWEAGGPLPDSSVRLSCPTGPVPLGPSLPLRLPSSSRSY